MSKSVRKAAETRGNVSFYSFIVTNIEQVSIRKSGASPFHKSTEREPGASPPHRCVVCDTVVRKLSKKVQLRSKNTKIKVSCSILYFVFSFLHFSLHFKTIITIYKQFHFNQVRYTQIQKVQVSYNIRLRSKFIWAEPLLILYLANLKS